MMKRFLFAILLGMVLLGLSATPADGIAAARIVAV
jgi:hypothetical protein